ncbi:MAG: FtsW/RodA/SpoVE family cell cycle protein [Coprobacter sp.]|nr:FtsW/RodA/SpoVE family cell cycle protein [Coprobacter sp.]
MGLQKLLKGDKYIWGIYMVLCIISILEIYSATSMLTYKTSDYFAPMIKHALMLFTGTLLMLGIQNVHYKWFKIIGLPLLVISFFLLIYTLLAGIAANDAKRWTTILGITFQPSELAKLGMIIFTAFVLANKQRPDGVEKNTFKIIASVTGIFCALIFSENLSTTLLLGAVIVGMMMVGRVELKKIFGTIGILILLGGLGIFVAPKIPGLERVSVWEKRIVNFIQKEDIPAYQIKIDDDNFQEQHARLAIANGGAFGKFWGNSREREVLPQAYSDFIYAIIIEEMGFVGGIFVMFLYISLLIRAGMIARKCTRAFPAFLILGTAMMIVFQALINMAVAVGLIPVTGQPLPLISRGGTSIIITCVYFGIILSISRSATAKGIEEEKQQTGSETEIPQDLSAPNPNMNL